MEEIYITYIPKLNHIENQLTFYGINNEAKEKLLQLKNFFSNYSNIFLQGPKGGKFRTGEFVLVFLRQQWFRGEILAFPASYDCTVKLLDYGNEETIPLTSVTPLSGLDPTIVESICFSPLAEKYILSGLFLLSDHLSDSNHAMLVNLLQDKIFAIKKLRKIRGIDSVIMANHNGDVVDILAQLNVGIILPSLDQPPPISKAVLPAPIQSTVKPSFESLVLDLDVILKVRVSSVDKEPLKFSIQLVDKLQELENLSTVIAQSHRFQPLTEAWPTFPCIALSSSNRKYYRAVISKVTSSESIYVYYVDYGHKEVLPINQLYEIPNEFLIPKTYSVRCSLIDFNAEGSFSEKFEMYTKGKIFDCKVRKISPHEVQLYYESRSITDIVTDLIINPCGLVPGKSVYYEKLNIRSNFEGNVVVTNMESPSNFYVVQEGSLSGIAAFEAFLNSPNYTSSLQPMSVSQMSAMTPCLGAVGPNLQYQRCLLVQEPEKSGVYLKSVDTGIVSCVSIDKVLPIRSETVTIMAAQALLCTLDGFEGRSVLTSVVNEFKALVSDKLLKMRVLKICGEKLVVSLLDTESGQEINQILAASMSPRLTPSQQGVRAAISKPVGNPPCLTLNEVESVWCMLAYPENKFFGQLERFSNDELDNMQCELLSVYTSLTNPPLLYADVKSHISDCAVVRFPDDNAYYRAKVLKEIAQDVEVMLIDYGNFLTVDRSEVFRPVSMKYWNHEPFGHLFQFDVDVPSISCDELTSVLVEKSVELQVVKQNGNIAIVLFTEAHRNQPIASMFSQLHYKQNPKGNVFSRLGPITEQQTGKEYHPKRHAVPEDFRKELSAPKPLRDERNRDDRSKKNLDSKFEKKDPTFDRYSQLQETSESDWEPSTKSTWNERKRDEPTQRSFESKNWRNNGDGEAFKGQTRERGNFAGEKPREPGRDRGVRFEDATFNQYGVEDGKFHRGGGKPRFDEDKRNWATSNTDDDENWNQVVAPVPVTRKALKFKPISLSVGVTEKCQVVYVNSPVEFYVQLEKNIPEIDAMSQKINSYFSEKISPKMEFKENTVCCAKFTVDGMWYRGVIEKVCANSAMIHFVDYGNRQETDLSDLRDLKEDQVALPAQACKCALSFVDAGEEMKPLFEEETGDKSLSITVVRKIASSRTFVVNLKDEGESLNVKFGGLGVVAPFQDTLSPPMFTTGIPQDAYLCYYESPVYFSLGNVSKKTEYNTLLNELNDFYNGLTDTEMKQDIIEVGTTFVLRSADDGMWNRSICERVEGQTFTVLLLDYGAHEIHSGKKNFHSLHPRFAVLPARALRCKLKGVVVSESYTSSIIESKLLAKDVVQVIPFEPVDDLHPVSIESDGTDVASALIEAGVVLKEPQHLPIDVIANALSNPLEELGTGPKAGDLVSAIFDEDGLFYRANVKSIENGQANVYFIDYGNESVAKVEELRKIPCSIASIPPQLETPIDKITKELTSKLEPLPSVPQSGDPVAVQFEDGLYYRAEILSISENIVNVYFIDYGNEDTTEIQNLRQIPECIRKIPPQFEATATEPVESVISDTLGKDSINQIAKELAGVLEPLLGVPKAGDSVAALFEDGLYYRAEISSISENIVIVYFIDYGNEDTTETQKLRQIPECIRKIPPQFEATATEPVESVISNTLGKDSINQIAKELAGVLEPLSGVPKAGDSVAALFEDGLYYRAEISSISENIVNVYFIDYGNEDTTEIEDLRKIPEGIRKIPPQFEDNEPVESVINDTLGKDSIDQIAKVLEGDHAPLSGVPQAGDSVAALFEDRYYRAEISSISENIVNVYFIDYGNEDTTEIQNLRQIPECIRKIPPQFEATATEPVEPVIHEISGKDLKTWVPEQGEAVPKESVIVNISEALKKDIEPLKKEPQIGDLVAAAFDEAGPFYRAQVMELMEGNASLISIDYGKSCTVSITKLKEIPSSIYSYPPQLQPEIIDNHSGTVASEEQGAGGKDADRFLKQKIQDALVGELSPLETAPQKGCLVAAFFKLDKLYHRAQIKSIHDDQARVVFIDYGNEIVTDVASMKEIPELIKNIRPLFKEEVKDVSVCVVAEEDIDSLVYENSKDECLVSENAWEAIRAAFELPLKSIDNTEAGDMIACLIDGKFERARVLSCDDKITCNLIDIGKTVLVDCTQLYDVPLAIRDIPPLSKVEIKDSMTKTYQEFEEASRGISSPDKVEVQKNPQDFKSLNMVETQDYHSTDPIKVEETPQDVQSPNLVETQDISITDPLKVDETPQDVLSVSSVENQGSLMVSPTNMEEPTPDVAPVSEIETQDVLSQTSILIRSQVASYIKADENHQIALPFPEIDTQEHQIVGISKVEEMVSSNLTRLGDKDPTYVLAKSQTSENMDIFDAIATALSKDLLPYSGDIIIGAKVAAEIVQDGLYYRSVITDFAGDDVTVVFTDYGKSGTTSRERLKEIPASVYNLPSCFGEEPIINGETDMNISVKAISSDAESIKKGDATEIRMDDNASLYMEQKKDIQQDPVYNHLVPGKDGEKSESDLL